MPVYNAENYLNEAIDSILNQTFIDFEFLIINDGSTDRSEEIIISYKDKRIKYFKNEVNLKLIKTLNKGIALATGKYLVRMDADDISVPTRLEEQINFMNANDKIIVAGSWFINFDKNSNIVKYPIDHDRIVIDFLFKCSICHPSTIWRLEKIREYKFDESFEHAEDYHFWIKLLEVGEIANIPKPMLYYRIHENSVSKKYESIQKTNSIIIRQDLFQKFGIKVQFDEIIAFESMCYADWKFFRNRKQLEVVGQLTSKLIQANKTSLVVNELILNEFLAQKWLHLNLNCGSYKLFQQFKPAFAYDLVNLVKLFLKSLKINFNQNKNV
jgi:glycosyltransferase involved in cell wall biosynthesis